MLIYADPRCLAHDVPPRHPERADRLRSILTHFDEQGLLASSTVRHPVPAERAALSAIHNDGYLDELQRMRPASGLVRLDPDTSMGPGSLDAAALAAGAVADAVR